MPARLYLLSGSRRVDTKVSRRWALGQDCCAACAGVLWAAPLSLLRHDSQGVLYNRSANLGAAPDRFCRRRPAGDARTE